MSVLTPNLLTISALLAAFAAAVAGSLHCAGMCGPLRLLCSDIKGARWKYQTGRALTYGLLGALAGGVGFVLPIWALVGLLLFTFMSTVLKIPTLPAWVSLRRGFLRLGSTSPFLLGISSGVLPCGLLHGWLAAAAATGHPIHGGALLLALWAGSLPALELSPFLLKTPLSWMNRRYPKAVKLSLLGIALLPLCMRLPMAGNSAVASSSPQCHHEHSPANLKTETASPR